MTKLIIGCDPDSLASGFAVYVDGELVLLRSMTIIGFIHYLDDYLDKYSVGQTELHIENLNAHKSSAFAYNRRDNEAVKGKKSESVGKCKQVQTEIERIAEHYGIKIIRHPVSPAWKSQSQKKVFEQVTHWDGASNADTRSAAYFGYLGVMQSGDFVAKLRNAGV